MFTLDPQTVTLRRFVAPITWVDGEPVCAVESETTCPNVEVQDLTGQELQILSEGNRSRDPRCIHIDTPLLVADSEAGVVSDQIDWNGHTYDVHKITWDYSPTDLLPHTEATILRLQEGQP